MSYLVEIPVEAGGRLVVETAATEVPEDLQLAAGAGAVVARATASLEQALDQITPAMNVVLARLSGLAPAELEVEFGIRLGGQAGVVVASTSSDVHFTVRLAWRREAERPAGAPAVGDG